MKLELKRWVTLDKSTLGSFTVDEHFQCFSLEDPPNPIKVAGITGIPAGTYDIKLRTVGRVHTEYAARFPEHRGMLWLQNVPDFQWVYLHCGNLPTDTDGCILLGDTLRAAGRVDDSVQAYRRVYALVLAAIDRGEPVTLEVL